MKYIGYVLFFSVFLLVQFVEEAKGFFLLSLDLAPEITYFILAFYIYVVFIAVLFGLFPKLVSDRTAVFNSHLKMSCSVMVSLGLVGTFLGLVDMISGIGSALSADSTDFAKRMESLLTAISTSLSAMSFAFMTSILGVGISAYSLVAGNFILTTFEESNKKKSKQEKAASSEKYLLDNESIFERLSYLETKLIDINLTNAEEVVSSYSLFNLLKEQSEQLVEHANQTSKFYEKIECLLQSISSEQVKEGSVRAENMSVIYCDVKQMFTLLNSILEEQDKVNVRCSEGMKLVENQVFNMSNQLSSLLLKQNEKATFICQEMKTNNQHMKKLSESSESIYGDLENFQNRLKNLFR